MKKKNNLIDLQQWRKHNLHAAHAAVAPPSEKPPVQTRQVEAAFFFELPETENDAIEDEQLCGMLIW